MFHDASFSSIHIVRTIIGIGDEVGRLTQVFKNTTLTILRNSSHDDCFFVRYKVTPILTTSSPDRCSCRLGGEHETQSPF